jgi:predicted glycoside hydrolase/deacetylase ChbG (UPF0249 family)
MRIVTTIDDLGLHPAVLRAVLRLREKGRPLSASLLMNAPHAAEALNSRELFMDAGLGIGVQLSILRGKPLSRQEDVNTLIRHDGRFLGDYGELFARFLDGKVALGQIELEWEAQMRRVEDAGITITHLASDAGVHAWPGLTVMLGNLAQRHGVAWIRRPRKCEGVLSENTSRARSQFMNICTMLRQLPGPVDSPDLVWGETHEQIHPENIARELRQAEPAPEVVEVVCRPGVWKEGDPEADGAFGPAPGREKWNRAQALLELEDWAGALAGLGATAEHFGTLKRSGR